MSPLATFAEKDAARVRVVFTDIDDTLTTEGKILAPAFGAVWELAKRGVDVVLVTGRPAGWCDHFARMWPIAGIVGENGAFYFRYHEKKKKLDARFLLDAEERADLQRRLSKVGKRILKQVPGTALASDQPYRIHDLAIDYCEDVKPLSKDAVARIVELFEEAGATAKVSSIHVNGWFGEYDKLGMMKRFAREVLELEIDDHRARARAVYAGDSPNDEPAFAFFQKTSVGVANIRRFEGELRHPPRYVTRKPGSLGFAELAAALLRARSTK